jgi:uncharacterized protein (TIGR02611 family)
LRGSEVDGSGVTPDSGRSAAREGDFRRVVAGSTSPPDPADLGDSPVSSPSSPVLGNSSVLPGEAAGPDDRDVTLRPDPPAGPADGSAHGKLHGKPRGLHGKPRGLRGRVHGRLRGRLRRARAALLRLRARAYATRLGRIGVKITVAVLGTLIIAVGVVLLPLPGPGWLIILGGLALLAMEFQWAKRLLRFTREQLLRWTRLVREGSWLVRIVSVGGLLLVVGGALVLSLAMLA